MRWTRWHPPGRKLRKGLGVPETQATVRATRGKDAPARINTDRANTPRVGLDTGGLGCRVCARPDPVQADKQ